MKTLELTEQEYAMLQTLCRKGLKEIENGVQQYSDLNVPTCFRNKCVEGIRAYRELVNRL